MCAHTGARWPARSWYALAAFPACSPAQAILPTKDHNPAMRAVELELAEAEQANFSLP